MGKGVDDGIGSKKAYRSFRNLSMLSFQRGFINRDNNVSITINRIVTKECDLVVEKTPVTLGGCIIQITILGENFSKWKGLDIQGAYSLIKAHEIERR